MKYPNDITYYSPEEEKINILTHGFGLVMSFFGLFVLVRKALATGDLTQMISFVVFGLSMILLYTASTVYHSAKKPLLRHRLNVLDHASIYVLIAGTYTPFALVTFSGRTGWVIFSVVWGVGLAGIIFKLFFAGRFQLFSTIMYVLMGTIIVYWFNPLMQILDMNGVLWLSAGGVSYIIGAVIFSIDKIRFNHAIFHVFVLLGTFCHFMSIYYYVVPT